MSSRFTESMIRMIRCISSPPPLFFVKKCKCPEKYLLILLKHEYSLHILGFAKNNMLGWKSSSTLANMFAKVSFLHRINNMRQFCLQEGKNPAVKGVFLVNLIHTLGYILEWLLKRDCLTRWIWLLMTFLVSSRPQLGTRPFFKLFSCSNDFITQKVYFSWLMRLYVGLIMLSACA